jgi:glutamate dehydrogenase/leucine dehydrogenase
MDKNLELFEEKEPELILRWSDSETEAKGWLVINSLKGGAAGGGTRMKTGIELEEVVLLAKTMEIKFTISGPPIGGAKSGIDFDPLDPRKEGVLRRWYKAILPMLKSCYGTGGDLNTDFINEVVPITQDLGVLHPQEGILVGHFNGNSIDQKCLQLASGTNRIVRDSIYTPDPNGNFAVADLISGYSVAESVVHYYKMFNRDLAEKKALIQGWGNVGSSAGYFLAQSGVKIIAILDINGAVFNEAGFSPDEIKTFMLSRKNNKFDGYPLTPYVHAMDEFWKLPADIFIPAAASKLITKNQITSLIENGLELVACGANVPFADNENFFGKIAEYTDNQISVIPDFIANCGMARVFAFLMQDDIEISDASIFEDVSRTVEKSLRKVCDDGVASTKLAQSVYQFALNDHN